jgi:hypothetical protein
MYPQFQQKLAGYRPPAKYCSLYCGEEENLPGAADIQTR